MSQIFQEPKVEGDTLGHSESVTTHPAFGQIRAARVSGRSFLYGSDFDHQNYIIIQVKRSELHRSLSNDWYFDREKLIEVALSEAQWATFVSSMNQQGVACTIQSFNGKMIPQIPFVEKRQDQFKREVDGRLTEAMQSLQAACEGVEASALSKKAKSELLSLISMARQNVSSNIGFVAEQFGEHIEKVTEDAKIEVNAYINNAIQRAGVAALQGGEVPFKLADESSPRTIDADQDQGDKP